MLPPAIAAAVFTTIAIVPPGGAPALGLRVEQAEGPVDASHPLLVRAAVEDALSSRWEVPIETFFRVRGAPPVRVARRPGVPYAFATVPVRRGAPFELYVVGDGLSAHVRVLQGRASSPPSPFEPVSVVHAEHSVEVRVEGGALVPEVPGTVFVHFENAPAGDVTMTAADDSVRVVPSHAQLDLCGVAAFEVTAHGLFANVVVQPPGADLDGIVRRALPMSPGGLAVAPRQEAIEVTAPNGGQPVYALQGDASGEATAWSVHRFDDGADANATMTIPLPSPIAWTIVSLSPVFDQGTGLWTTTPLSAITGRCAVTALGERFGRTRVPLPAVPHVLVLHDGARFALAARERRQYRARNIALGVASAAIAMLIGLIVAASARRDPEVLRDVALGARQRAWIALGGALVLLVGGLVLLGTYALRQ